MLQRLWLVLACTLILGLPWPVLPAVESPPPVDAERATPPATRTTSPSSFNGLVDEHPGHFDSHTSATPPAGEPTPDALDATGFLGIPDIHEDPVLP
jgi:hypothetical protein